MTTKEAIKHLSDKIDYAEQCDDKWVDSVSIKALYIAVRAMAEERKKGEWTTHEVACLLAEVMGDDCACNVNGNDEWLPFVCEFAETTCPDVVGVTCWEQWLIHRKEKEDVKTNRR